MAEPKTIEREVCTKRQLTLVAEVSALGETVAEWERIDDLIQRGLIIYRDEYAPLYLLVVLPDSVNEDLHALEDELACVAEAAALSDVQAAPAEMLAEGEIGWEISLGVANQSARSAQLTTLAQLCRNADTLVEQVLNQLEEVQQAGTLTSAEYDLLLAEVPSTNLSELRQRLLLAAEGKLRPRHLNSLLDDLLG